MDENSELLLYIYQNVSMGVQSTTDLIRILNTKDNKIKKVVEGELKGYEEFLKKVEKLLKKYKIQKQDKGMLTKLQSKVGMSMEMMKDNSDSKVADLLTKGFMMGNVDISKKIDTYEGDASKEILDLAKELLEYGKKNIEFLREYL